MGKRFLDLHVYSTDSFGLNTRTEMEEFAKDLGVDIRFCDGDSKDDGRVVSFKSASDLKKDLSKAAYYILEPYSKELGLTAARIKKSIINTELNPSIARLMNRNKCFFEFSLYPIVHSRGLERVRLLRSFKNCVKFARKYGVEIVATSGSRSIYDLRSPTQLTEILDIFGFKEDEVKKALFEAPEKIISRA